MRLYQLIAIVLSVFLVACASQTEYKAADQRGGYGYTETILSENRYRITFTGNSITPRETVQDYALLRAAELTLQEGYDWFKLVDRNTDRRDRTTVIDSGFHDDFHHTSVYQRCGLMSCDTVVTSGSHGHGSIGASTATTRSAYSQSLEVVMGKDPMPEDVETYDARKLSSTLHRWMRGNAKR